MSLREQKKKETRCRIFEISSRMFREKGFEKTTVDEITKEAGIAKGTFFNYFPTKESLLYYFREQKEEFIRTIMNDQISLGISSRQKIENFLVQVAEHYEKERELLRLLFFEQKKLLLTTGHEKSCHSDKRKKHEFFINMLADFVREGMHKGEIRSDADSKVVAEILYAVYFHSLMIWLHSEKDYSFSKDMSAKIAIIFEGIGV